MQNLTRNINDIFRVGLTLAMEVAAPTRSGGVRQRSDIAEKYKWRLDHIYASADEWRADLVRVTRGRRFSGRLAADELPEFCLCPENHGLETSTRLPL